MDYPKALQSSPDCSSRSHFPFVHPHSLPDTTWTLLWTENSSILLLAVVHLHLFGVSPSMCCSSTLWQKIRFNFFHLHSEKQQTLTRLSISLSLLVILLHTSSESWWFPVTWVKITAGDVTKLHFMLMSSDVMQWLPIEVQKAIQLIQEAGTPTSNSPSTASQSPQVIKLYLCIQICSNWQLAISH